MRNMCIFSLVGTLSCATELINELLCASQHEGSFRTMTIGVLSLSWLCCCAFDQEATLSLADPACFKSSTQQDVP